MKKLGFAGLIGVALLLAGCASEPAPVETVTVTPEAEAPTEKTEPVPAPITSTPAAEEDERPFDFDDYTDDELFIAIMETEWQGDNRPPDHELLGAAKLACDTAIAGTPWQEIEVVVGDLQNNHRVVQNAVDVYCPDMR